VPDGFEAEWLDQLVGCGSQPAIALLDIRMPAQGM
jgi:hypothetical protein